jgi:hypothetical protein
MHPIFIYLASISVLLLVLLVWVRHLDKPR